MMEETEAMSNACNFRGHSYTVMVQVQKGETLVVEVEDRLTSNQWRATFDAQYIEDLTRKTGDFKQFAVFVNMLESAVAQDSDSVSLDLLTYSDLESLRKHKTTSTNSTASSRTASLNTKRYLILTYTVEFDRIHYPLPLPYVGIPDPTILQDTVRKLRDEVQLLKKQKHGHHKDNDIDKLKNEFEALNREKDEQDSTLLELSPTVKRSDGGRSVKEVKMLKGIVKHMEEEMLREKTRYQRAAAKRQREYEELLAEVKELRATERNLRVRVKSLTNELAILKRQTTRHTNNRSATSRDRSYDRSYDRATSFTARRDHSTSRDRLPPFNRSTSRDRLTGRTSSTERPVSAPTGRSRERSSEWNGSYRRGRTPSPDVTKPRFDPTAYIQEKQRQRDEVVLSKQRRTSHRRYNSAERKSKIIPRGSTERINSSNRSRISSVGSRGYSSEDADLNSDSSYTRLQINKRKNRPKSRLKTSNTNLPSPNVSRNARNGDARQDQLISSTPESRSTLSKLPPKKQPLSNKENYKENGTESDFYDRSVEISEIDARLERLQKMMKTSLQCGT